MVDSIKSGQALAEPVNGADDDDDRDDPFDSDVTSEESDDDNDFMPERDVTGEGFKAAKIDRVIQKELDHQEAEADRLVNEELARHSKDGIDVLP